MPRLRRFARISPFMSNRVPLAERLRPTTLNDVVGQRHILGENSVLRKALKSGELPNMIFYGPPGVGKTTVATILSDNAGRTLHKLNGTNAGTADIKSVISDIGTLGNNGILLYLDEIQYLNKKQQQSLLESVESGDITLIASTTENPYFYVYGALLSRCSVFEFLPLTNEDIADGVKRAVERSGEGAVIGDEALEMLSAGSGGDMRKALTSLSLLLAGGDKEISVDMVSQIVRSSAGSYDKNGDIHYRLLSGLQKSIRGSDENAALHYLARLIVAGDIISPIRRLLVIAAEDIGLAYPQAMPIVKALCDSALQLGLPEGAIPLGEAAVLLATAPKSNTACVAIHSAIADVKRGGYGDFPRHLDNLQQGKTAPAYLYPHDYENSYVKQQYLPDGLVGKKYYEFGQNKNEQAAKAYWGKIKQE